MREKQIVFTELYEAFECGNVITVELQEEASKHGIRISDVEDAVIGAQDDDYDAL